MRSFRSFESVRALGLVLVVGAALAGCGSEAVADQGASPPEQPNYAGLSVYSLYEAGFTIGVPSGWTAMSAEDAHSASVDAIVKSDPKLGPYRDRLTAPDSPFQLVALEYDPEACICSTINVLVFPLDDTWRTRDFEAGALSGARKIALAGTKPKVERVKTPAGSGIRITTRTLLPGTDIKLISMQYFLHTARAAYILSYTASPEVTKTYAPMFERSARSLQEV